MAPWTTDSDSLRHHHKAKGRMGAKWRKVANAVLAKSGSDEKAIRIANTVVNHHAKRRGGKRKS